MIPNSESLDPTAISEADSEAFKFCQILVSHVNKLDTQRSLDGKTTGD